MPPGADEARVTARIASIVDWHGLSAMEETENASVQVIAQRVSTLGHSQTRDVSVGAYAVRRAATAASVRSSRAADNAV